MSLIVTSKGTLIASTGDYGYQALNDGYIYRSVDGGESWNEYDLEVESSNYIIEYNSKIYAATTRGIYISFDDGFTWEPNGLDTTVVAALDGYNQTGSSFLVAGTFKGIFKSEDDGQTWQKLSSQGCNDCLGIYNINTIFVGRIGAIGASLYVTRDMGLKWDLALYGLGATSINIYNDQIYAGGYLSDEWFGGLHHSIDGGVTWQEIFSHEKSVTSTLITSSNTIYLSGYYTGVQMMMAGDSLWSELQSGLSSTWIKSLALGKENYLYAASDLGGIFKSREPIE
jgi:photosystem II stability/assembly factor-like uncharacterized protein